MVILEDLIWYGLNMNIMERLHSCLPISEIDTRGLYHYILGMMSFPGCNAATQFVVIYRPLCFDFHLVRSNILTMLLLVWFISLTFILKAS